MGEKFFFRIGERAKVIRCQTPRNKADTLSERLIMGELPDGRILCREIGADNIDRVTGFSEINSNRAVEFFPTAKSEKYLLRENDIIFTFAGVARALAVAGLITKIEEPAMPARTVCVIRAFDIDPIWLFYQLRRESVKSTLASAASGKSGAVMTVNLENLRKAALHLPSAREIEAARAAHVSIIREAEKIRAARENVMRERARIDSLFALNQRRPVSLSR